MNRTRSEGWATGCAVVLALLAAGGLACSGSKSAGAGPVVATGFGAHDGTTGSGGSGGGGDGFELTQAAIDFQGGSSTSRGGLGKDGGDVHILASGDVTIDPSLG